MFCREMRYFQIGSYLDSIIDTIGRAAARFSLFRVSDTCRYKARTVVHVVVSGVAETPWKLCSRALDMSPRKPSVSVL